MKIGHHPCPRCGRNVDTEGFPSSVVLVACELDGRQHNVAVGGKLYAVMESGVTWEWSQATPSALDMVTIQAALFELVDRSFEPLLRDLTTPIVQELFASLPPPSISPISGADS